MPDIKIIPSKDIDRDKWDACVARNENGLIYARSFYLDALAPRWDAFVVGDYMAVMPLVWKRKYGIKYFCCVRFIQQLGFIGAIEISAKDLLKAIRRIAWLGDIPFNFFNDFYFLNRARTNQIIYLNREYRDIYQDYHPALKRNIKKAERNSLSYSKGCAEDISCFIDLHAENLADHYQEKEIISLLALSKEESAKQYFLIKKVVNKENIPLCISLCLKDHKRIYNTLLATSAEGKEYCAMPYLIDNIIKEYAQTNMIFDFQGSDIPGVKRFNSKFSPVIQPYKIYSFRRISLQDNP